VILLILILGWFALGTQRNIRKGNDLLKRLQEGLPLIGGRTTLKWLGSSVVQLDLTQTRPPLREASVLAVLEPRDIGILWAWGRGRGRRDLLILRARLERPPHYELEAGDTRTWTGGDALAKLDPEAWVGAIWDETRVAHTRDADLAGARQWWDRLGGAAGGIWRLSIRREPPHLEVHVPITPQLDPRALFSGFLEMASALAHRKAGQ
jgi:hypothetical protein